MLSSSCLKLMLLIATTARVTTTSTSAGTNIDTTTAAAAAATSSNDESGGGDGGGIESGFRAVYNGYKQCQGQADTLSCLKLKALKLVDRALSINNIPITEAISLAKREDSPRSLDEQWTAAAAAATNNAIDDESVAINAASTEGDEKLNDLLWKRVKQFVESRSLQLRVNKLLFGGSGSGDGNNSSGDYDYDYDYDENAANNVRRNAAAATLRDENVNATDDDGDARKRWTASTAATAAAAATTGARGKKDKNKGMYMYMMMMKGGMMALAYKGLALLAGKALLVSKIALTLALLVAIKKLFSSGHSQKTTYEIVKAPPIITHSHQYGGGGGGGGGPGAGNAQSGHYAADFTGYEGGPYARSLVDEPLLQQHPRSRVTLKALDTADVADSSSRHTATRTAASASSAQARSLAHRQQANDDDSEQRIGQYTRNIPYAHLTAYRRQLMEKATPPTTTTTIKSASSTSTLTSTPTTTSSSTSRR